TLFNAVSQLEIGEISPVIEGEMGYYIAVRQPINLDYITENIDSFIQLYQEMKVKDLLMAESADCVVEYNDSVYKKISVWNMD
ncbi:MAG: hypothetical protein IKZ19_02335, partial [Clostridia bacterium]|nr:hypothetical protein [Clostridia bacterium]